MSAKQEPAQPIGEAPCPIEGCGQVVKVYRYRERSGRGSMFKGKFYASCPTHGRVIEAARAATQEHVLEKGTIWGPKATTAPAAAEPAAVAAEPAKAVTVAPQKAVAAPAREPTAPTRAQRFLQGWNLWSWWPGASAKDS